MYSTCLMLRFPTLPHLSRRSPHSRNQRLPVCPPPFFLSSCSTQDKCLPSSSNTDWSSLQTISPSSFCTLKYCNDCFPGENSPDTRQLNFLSRQHNLLTRSIGHPQTSHLKSNCQHILSHITERAGNSRLPSSSRSPLGLPIVRRTFPSTCQTWAQTAAPAACPRVPSQGKVDSLPSQITNSPCTNNSSFLSASASVGACSLILFWPLAFEKSANLLFRLP